MNVSIKYFFSILSLAFYELSGDNDDMANYLVLSLQMDNIRPTPVKVRDEKELERMEKKLLSTMEKFELTRLELFRNIAVKCEDFIVFYRDNSFGSDMESWPQVCGQLFYKVPIFTPFGTCFTTNITVRYWKAYFLLSWSFLCTF